MSSNNSVGAKFTEEAHATFVRSGALDGHKTFIVNGNSWAEIKANAAQIAQEYVQEFNIDCEYIKVKIGKSENIVEKAQDLLFTVNKK